MIHIYIRLLELDHTNVNLPTFLSSSFAFIRSFLSSYLFSLFAIQTTGRCRFCCHPCGLPFTVIIPCYSPTPVFTNYMVCQFRSTYGTSHSMPASYVEGLYLVADRPLLRVLTDFPSLVGSPPLTYSQFFIQIHPSILQYIQAQIKLFAMKVELP